MKRYSMKFCIFAFLTLISCSTVLAQSDSQGFRVIVPTGLSIVAPPSAELTHNESDANQAFPPQAWVVKGNASAGLNVTFTASDAFVHTSGNFRRNAALSLAMGETQGPASWSVTTVSDSTDYATNDFDATVAAASDGVGRANLNLTVTFVTEEFGLFAAGDYNTTVVGTVAAN